MTPLQNLQSSGPPASPLRNKGRRRRSLISLTPLIDVVFILLVFFMLATVFERWNGIDLDAPSRTSAAPSMEGAMLVEIREDGLRLSGEPVTPERLVQRVRERLGRKADQRFVVKPSGGVSLQRTVAVVERIVAAGGHDVSFVREGD